MKYPCNILSSYKFCWFLTMLDWGENLNLKDWSSSFHHSCLICEHHEKTGTRKLSAFYIHSPFLFSPSLHRFSRSAYTIKLQSTNVDMLHQTIWESITVTPADNHVFITWVSFWNRTCCQAGLHSVLCSAGRLQSMIGTQDVISCAKHRARSDHMVADTYSPLLQHCLLP